MPQCISLPEPYVLSASTYFWSAGGNASARRRNEERHHAAVSEWFESLGMRVTNGSGVTGEYGDVRATFSYSESCRNVYRRLVVTKGGRRSNITALRALGSPSGRAAATRRANIAVIRTRAEAISAVAARS